MRCPSAARSEYTFPRWSPKYTESLKASGEDSVPAGTECDQTTRIFTAPTQALTDTANKIAATIAAKSPLAVKLGKRALRGQAGLSLADAYVDRLTLNVYTGPGALELGIDDLEIGPVSDAGRRASTKGRACG